MIRFGLRGNGGQHARIGRHVGIAVFLCRPGGAGACEAPAAHDPGHRERRAGLAGWRVRAALRGHGPPVGRTGAAAARLAAAGVLLGALRAPADGADRLQPAVPLVRGAGHRRCRVGPLDVLQEPRPAAGCRCCGEVPRGGAAPSQGQALPVGRSLLGRRHAGGGVGQPQELPRQGRQRRAAHAWPQRRTRFPRREARQRHARKHDRSRCQALSQGQEPAGQALLHGPRADREPARPGRAGGRDAGDRQGRAAGCVGDDRQARSRLGAPAHAGRRQGLRHLRLRRRSQADVRDAARGAEGQGIGHRRPHHTACGLRGEPAQTQAGRGGVRLGQDHRRPRKGESARAATRELQVHLRDGRLQSDPHAQAAGRRVRKAVAMVRPDVPNTKKPAAEHRPGIRSCPRPKFNSLLVAVSPPRRVAVLVVALHPVHDLRLVAALGRDVEIDEHANDLLVAAAA